MSKEDKVDETDPIRDMSKHGFLKKLTWLDVKRLDNGQWQLKEIDYDVRAFHCDSCNSSDYLWLAPQRAGVYLACVMCETVDGPISRDEGDTVVTKIIQPAEALMILESRGALIPRSLRKAVGKRRSRIRRGERPTKKF